MTAQPYLNPNDCHCNASMTDEHARGCPMLRQFCGETHPVTAGAGAWDTGTCWLRPDHDGEHAYMVERPDPPAIVQRPTFLYPSASSVADLHALIVREQEKCLTTEGNGEHWERLALRHGVLQEVREWIADWYESEQADPDGQWDRLKAEGYSEAELRSAAGDR